MLQPIWRAHFAVAHSVLCHSPQDLQAAAHLATTQEYSWEAAKWAAFFVLL